MHATDIFSYSSFYNLRTAYKQFASRIGPIPPARMIRPSGLVFWNLEKGGVDEFNRALKSLCQTNSLENPIFSMLRIILIAQVNRAAVVHWFALGKWRGLLPDTTEFKICFRKEGCSALRHEETRGGTFSGLTRELAKYFYVYKTNQSDRNDPESGSGWTEPFWLLKLRSYRYIAKMWLLNTTDSQTS